MSECSANLGAVSGASVENPELNQGEQGLRQLSEAELNKLLTSEGDKRVQQALSSFREKELPGIIERAKAEAERLALMSKEEKFAALFKAREDELSARQAAVSERELRLEARQLILERGLSAGLVDALNFSSREALEASVVAVEAAVRAGIEQGVNARLGSGLPKAQLSVKGDALLESSIHGLLGLK